MTSEEDEGEKAVPRESGESVARARRDPDETMVPSRYALKAQAVQELRENKRPDACKYDALLLRNKNKRMWYAH